MPIILLKVVRKSEIFKNREENIEHFEIYNRIVWLGPYLYTKQTSPSRTT